MRYISSILLAIFFVGCGIKEVEQRPQSYRLQNIQNVQPFNKTDKRVLKVERIQGNNAVMSRSILYIKDGALKPFKYNRWSEIPSTRLQQIFVEYLENTKLFRATISNSSFANNDLILESDLQNFEQVFDEDKSIVHVKLRFHLIDKQNAKILGSTSIDIQEEVKQNTTQAVINAFNKAINKVTSNLGLWIEGLL